MTAVARPQAVVSPDLARQNAPLTIQLMDAIGERWMIAILLQVVLGARRFNEMKRNLNISGTVLSGKLRTLISLGLLERQEGNHHLCDHHEYVLTSAGQALQTPLVELMRWANDHLVRNGPSRY